jgi:anti-sigma B factor antagonist
MAHRHVTVKRLPETLDVKSERRFCKELETAFIVEKPAIVIDCSHVRHMDNAAVHLLLCCLEEAMKRNGDIRLAGLSIEAEKVFARTGVDRLFRVFDSTEKAVESFQRRIAFMSAPMEVPSEQAA